MRGINKQLYSIIGILKKRKTPTERIDLVNIVQSSIVQKTNDHFLDGHSLVYDEKFGEKEFRGGCSPEVCTDICLSPRWFEEHKKQKNNDGYWNSLILVIAHELTHFDIEECDRKVKKIISKEKRLLINRNKVFSNWIKEIYCDLYGAKRANKTANDLDYRFTEYPPDCPEDNSSYPSNEHRKDFVTRGTFDNVLIRDMAEIIYGKNIISDDCIDQILEAYGGSFSL